MLTSHKLLYILPDVAYIVELLPTKKEHTFAIQTYRQINGDFIDDNDFIAENIQKLINKIDPEEYHLILPDFLFTNTIVEVKETDESKVASYLKEKLLPELTLSPATHEIKTFVLTQYGGKSRVQLSALEKSLVNPISATAKETGLKISNVSPLSWTIKSIVSLEPSISVVQMGSTVYLAQHYIGIDQAISSSVEEVVTLSETIKTLKGAEPSIQTVYLISNSLVEEELKENLSDTLPLQQLANFKEDDSEMPSYVKFAIESGMKTLSLDSFPVPRFPLSEPTGEVASVTTSDSSDEDDGENSDTKEETTGISSEKDTSTDASEDAIESSEDTNQTDSDLPKPSMAETGATAATVTAPASVSEIDISSDDTDSEDDSDSTSSTDAMSDSSEKASESTSKQVSSTKTTEPEDSSDSTTNSPIEDSASEEKAVSTSSSKASDSSSTSEDKKLEKATDNTTQKSESTTAVSADTESPDDDEDDENSNTSSASSSESVSSASSDSKKNEDSSSEQSESSKKTVIKNQSGLQPMLKMLGVSFLVFLITVGVGIGIGRSFIYLSQQQSGETTESPVVEEEQPAEETEEPTPSPSPEPELDLSEISILVVNATTQAGYAGENSDLLDEAGFGQVDASNANGDYEEGILLLAAEEDEALIEAVEEALGVTVTYSDEIEVEDPSGEYDAVVVLAE